MESKRVVMDCRKMPEANCTLTIAGTESEVLDAAAQHAVSKHGMKDTPDTRRMLRSSWREEVPAHT